MNAILDRLARIVIGKHVLRGLASIHNALDGRKSEVSAVLLGIVHILKLAEVIPAEAADKIEQVLLTVLPLALADRASKVMKSADTIAQAPTNP